MTHAGATNQAEHPPLPEARCISPAVEDYATRSSLPRLLWPVIWLLALGGLAVLLTAQGWHEEPSAVDHAPGQHAPGPHGPGHDAPADAPADAPGDATDEHGAPDPSATEAPGHSESR